MMKFIVARYNVLIVPSTKDTDPIRRDIEKATYGVTNHSTLPRRVNMSKSGQICTLIFQNQYFKC